MRSNDAFHGLGKSRLRDFSADDVSTCSYLAGEEKVPVALLGAAEDSSSVQHFAGNITPKGELNECQLFGWNSILD
jgi:hypothetical protein